MKNRPDIEETVEWLRGRGYYGGQITHQQVEKGQSAETADIGVSDPLSIALRQSGISSLYSHQVEAIEAVQSGENVVVATPTASGKTLTYVVPGIERAIESTGRHSISPRTAHSLMIKPTRSKRSILS